MKRNKNLAKAVNRDDQGYLVHAVQRFMDNVEILGDKDDPDACWRWLGSSTKEGYGLFTVMPKVRVTAHRFSYIVFNGPMPEDTEPHHTCDNPWCVNPRHLEAMTHYENFLRGKSEAAQKARWSYCKRGHPFTEENTGTDHRGNRFCKTCRKSGAYNTGTMPRRKTPATLVAGA